MTLSAQNGGRLANQDISFTSAVELSHLIRRKAISPVEIVRATLERIEKVNPIVNAYVTVAADSALESARRAESAIMQGEQLGVLHGIPVGIKDVIPTAGIRTTFGSKLFRDFVPSQDDLAVERLKTSGAIIVGKTNTPEFGCGGNTVNEIFGSTRNPWDTNLSAGGSSGGSTAAVASGLGPISLGSDLGGSLRIPAAFCGIVGFRPTPGRIPRYPNVLTFDDKTVQGPIARTVPDVALMLDAMCGCDRRTPVSLPALSTDWLEAIESRALRGLKIAWSDNLNLLPVAAEILEVAKKSLGVFAELGCEVTEDCPDFTGVRDEALVFRGLQYVALYREQLEERHFLSSLGPNMATAIRQGLNLTVKDVARAERHRSQLFDKVRLFFDKYDLLALPTVPILPFPVEWPYPVEINGQPMATYIDWCFLTYAISMIPCPAISVPCGWSRSGLPVGLQLVGACRNDEVVLSAAAAFEKAKPWTEVRPPLKPHPRN